MSLVETGELHRESVGPALDRRRSGEPDRARGKAELERRSMNEMNRRFEDVHRNAVYRRRWMRDNGEMAPIVETAEQVGVWMQKGARIETSRPVKTGEWQQAAMTVTITAIDGTELD